MVSCICVRDLYFRCNIMLKTYDTHLNLLPNCCVYIPDYNTRRQDFSILQKSIDALNSNTNLRFITVKWLPYICHGVVNLLVLGVDEVLNKLDVVRPVRHPELKFWARNNMNSSKAERTRGHTLCSPRSLNNYCFNNRYPPNFTLAPDPSREFLQTRNFAVMLN